MFSITHVPTPNSSPHCNISLFLRCPSMVCPAPRRLQAVKYVLGGQIDKRIIDWLGGQWTLVGVIPSNFLISVSDPWRAFWADTAPFKGPRLMHCFRSYRNTRTLSGVQALSAEVPGHRQKKLTQTLIVRFLKTALFTPIPDCAKLTE